MPARRERAGLGFAVADHASDNQVRIVEYCAVGVSQGVAELTTFVNGARRLGRGMAWNAVRPGELAEQPLNAVGAALYVRVALGIGAFEIGICHEPRPTMPGSRDQNHIEVLPSNDAIEMDIDEIETGRRTPMTEKPRLDVR